MSPELTAPLQAGGWTGRLFWSLEAAAYGARLHPPEAELGLLDPPMTAVVVGGRPGWFTTVDAVLDHLGLLGLHPEGRSGEQATGLRLRVRRVFGESELVGTTRAGVRRLHLVTASGAASPLPPAAIGPLPGATGSGDHGWDWGRRSPATLVTARALLTRTWSGRWGPAEELAAEVLARTFLAEAGPSFSVSADALCEWFLFDGELSTGLDPAALDRLIDRDRPGRRSGARNGGRPPARRAGIRRSA